MSYCVRHAASTMRQTGLAAEFESLLSGVPVASPLGVVAFVKVRGAKAQGGL